MSDKPAGVTALLSPEALAALRGGYRPEVMAIATRKALNGRYPGGAPLVDRIVDVFYTGEPLSGADRERTLVALLAARGEGLTLGVHLYWALMEGLDTDELAHVLLLVGAYTGVPTYAAALLVLERTLKALAALTTGDADAGSPAVIEALLAEFR